MAWRIKDKGRSLKMDGVLYEYGDIIPDEAVESMRGYIEEEKEAVKKEVKEKDGTAAELPSEVETDEGEEIQEGEMTEDQLSEFIFHKGGGVYELTNGETVRGKEEAIKQAAELLQVEIKK